MDTNSVLPGTLQSPVPPGDDELAVYKVMLMEDSTTITLASDNVFEYRDYQPQEVKQQEASEKTAAYQQKVQSEMEPYAENFDAIIEGYEENLSVGFYSEGTVWSKEVGEYEKLSGTPLSSEISLYIAEDKTRAAVLCCQSAFE